MLFSAVLPFVFGGAGGGNDGLIIVIAAVAGAIGVLPAVTFALLIWFGNRKVMATVN